ncbi:hybrid sensor histidine kinase/response regulator [Shewanella maritima]|uniref:hybrid sensor histidine kinase/response regulator n=1 Tax=Shewanella maritima TaxID=2520507 RepID=UPI001A9233F4|nr:response regulator [Shewanella maritima]
MQQTYKLVRKESPYKELSVLIVDDFDAVTRTLYKAFETLGFKTIIKAKNGKDALMRLEHNIVDIIVSDWKMPKMDGLELLRKVRSHEAYKNVPFIMLTGNLVQSDVVEAIEAGVSEYLIKPFSMASLSERVHKAFVSPIPTSAVAQLAAEKQQAEQKPTKRTVLIVDDEPSNLQVLGGLLKDDYKTIVCRSGSRAIEVCAKPEKPDLILLDIMMPEMDGLAVCKALKDNPETEFIPIIFVTALSQNDDVVKGLSLGAVDYITKPIFPEVVKARVATHIQSVIQREKLVSQIDTLVNSARSRDELQQTFHHDIRNPLMAILSVLPTIKVKELDDVENIGVVSDSAQIMVEMLDKYGLLQEVEQGRFNKPLIPVSVKHVVHRVIGGIKQKLQQKRIKLELNLSEDHMYLGDELLSFIMLSNLLNNAIEAAPPSSPIQVTSKQLESEIRLVITNQGEVPINIQGSSSISLLLQVSLMA